MLADYPWILECCGAGHIYVFQYWHLVDQGWILIPFMTTAIGIEDDVDTIFLRVYGVKTISLALELRRYEDLHGLGLHPDDPLSKYISQDVVNHVWLVFWKEVRNHESLISSGMNVRPFTRTVHLQSCFLWCFRVECGLQALHCLASNQYRIGWSRRRAGKRSQFAVNP